MVARRLVVVTERDHSYIDLDEEATLTIGRAPDNAIVTKDDMVSRRHCSIELDGAGSLRVRDLKSFNGTYLNGRRIRDEPLHTWDALRVGRTKLFVVERGETPVGEPSESGVIRAAQMEEAQGPPPAAPAAQAEDDLSKTKTLNVTEVLGLPEIRKTIDDVVRQERAEVEHEIVRRVRDESGPAVLASLSGFKVRVQRAGPADGGGDFYDVFREPNRPEELSLCAGTVSGVGIAACVAATVGRHSVRGMLGLACEESPRGLVEALRGVLEATLHPGSALSLLLARLEATGKLSVAATGGVGVLHYKAESGSVEVLRPPGRRDEEAGNLEEVEVRLRAGDRLVLASDGAGSIRDREGKPYGAHRLRDKLGEVAGQGLSELLAALVRDYQRFAGDALERDVTLVAVAPGEEEE